MNAYGYHGFRMIYLVSVAFNKLTNVMNINSTSIADEIIMYITNKKKYL